MLATAGCRKINPAFLEAGGVETSAAEGTTSGSDSEDDETAGADGASGPIPPETDDSDGMPSSSSDDGADDDGDDGDEGFMCTWDSVATPNVSRYPVEDDGTLTLLPDDVLDAAVVTFCEAGPQLPYRLSFEFSIDDEDGGDIYATADGLVAFFAKDTTAYGVPPAGGSRGFIEDGSGYGVHFAIYETRRIIVRDGDGNELDAVEMPQPSLYTDGAWRSVALDVYSDHLEVSYEGERVLEVELDVSPMSSGIGIGAATGAADGRHRIRKLDVEAL